MTIRYYLMIAWMIAFFPAAVVAVPAYPGLVKLLQPDGEEVTVYVRGDEKIHWLESPDGYSLMYDGGKRIVFAVTDATGNMVPSAALYRDVPLRSSVDSPPADIPKGLRYSASQASMLNQIWNVTERSLQQAAAKAATGTVRAICPLVQFPDRSFGKTKEAFEQLMNQVGYAVDGAKGSVRDFYDENSYGKMNLTVTVAGPYTASHDLSYYGANESDDHMDVKRMIELAREMADCVFAEGENNAADYDNDNDGFIDAFHFIFAGYGEEAGGNPNTIWSHELQGFTPYVSGGKKLDRYSCSPELRGSTGDKISRIGVICHEMGHVFGLPDFYDVDAGASGGDNPGAGKWDLMANGAWNGAGNDGSSPAHINMYAKIQLGWVNPVILDSPREITGMPGSAKHAAAYVLNTPVSGEYYVLENRQKAGFDSYIPGTGMLIYHVSLTGVDIEKNAVNTAHPQKMYPVCASSAYKIPYDSESYGTVSSAGCPFPGTSGKTSFTDATTPAAFTWEGRKIYRPITAIREQNGLISFRFMQNEADSVSGLTLTKDGYDIHLNWEQTCETVSGYNVYRDGRLLSKLQGADNTSYSQYNVVPGNYNYCVTAYYDGDKESIYCCREISTGEDVEKYLPVSNLNVAVDGQAVKLTWNPPATENDRLTHSGDIKKIIYFNDIEKFSAVVRFTKDDLKSSIGNLLSQVSFHVYNKDCKHRVQVWYFTPARRDTLLFPDVKPVIDLPVQNAGQGLTDIALSPLLTIEPGKELWIGINYELTPITFVTAVDNGPKVPNRNFLMADNIWYTLPESGDYNFYITAGLTMPDTPDKYFIYRDDVRLNDVTAESYTDAAVPDGNHTYCISAVYGDRESERVCIETPFLTGMLPAAPSGSVQIHPNPLKRDDLLTVDLGEDFAGTRLCFRSISGQLLRQVEVSGPVYRQKTDFAPGIYILQIRKKSQTINRKMIVDLD